MSGRVLPPQQPGRRWRDYRTAAGGRPVHDFLFDELTSEERADVVTAMKDSHSVEAMERDRHA